MFKRESDFQKEVINIFKASLPDSIILKLDANYIQGIPDLLILSGSTWAALECKISEDASHRPNQDFYVCKMSEMSRAYFVYPENLQRVLCDVIYYFKYMETIEFDSKAFEEYRKAHSQLETLINTYKYDQIAAY